MRLSGPRLLPLLLLLGAALRLYHTLREPSLWQDEAALVLNVLRKDFGELLGPLLFHEAAPPLFLWLERATVLALGDSLWALRLPPLLASLLSLGLFASAARRLLPPAAAAWAVFFFACSDRLLWHACEAKPYGFDVLAATALIALYGASENWPLPRRLAAFALAAPPLIWLVYPGGFLYGGVLAACLPAVLRERSASARWAYAALCAAVVGAFISLALGPAAAQRSGAMDACWTAFFPRWEQPLSVPGWAAAASLGVLHYSLRPLGEILVLPLLLAAGAWWRGGRRPLVLLLLVPVALALLAACLGRYPYGDARVLVYAAPAVALLAAAGIPPLLQWVRTRTRAGDLVLVVVLLAPLFRAGHRVVVPWDRADCAAAAACVLARRQPGEPVVANHWEYAYYFRALGSQFTLVEPGWDPLQQVHPVRGGRYWFLFTAWGPTAEQRVGMVRRLLAPGDALVAVRHFTGATVVEVARVAPGLPPR